MISPFNKPINVAICKGDGTIFSSNNNGGGSSSLSFVNIGTTGARIFISRINDTIQFYRTLQGNNVKITEQADGVRWDVDDLLFDSSAPIKRAIPGLQGIILNKSTVLATIQELLYPILPPTISLSLSPTQFEIGDTSNIVANYNVTRVDEEIASISVNNQSITPITGQSQAGAVNVSKTGLVNVTVPMQVTTATKTVNTSSTASVFRKIRIGGSSKNGINPTPITDADINILTGYFSSTPILSPKSLTLTNQYLVITIPTALGGIPTFKINGFVNNAFNKVRNDAFVNSFGYSDLTGVWVSTTPITGLIQLEIV